MLPLIGQMTLGDQQCDLSMRDELVEGCHGTLDASDELHLHPEPEHQLWVQAQAGQTIANAPQLWIGDAIYQLSSSMTDEPSSIVAPSEDEGTGNDEVTCRECGASVPAHHRFCGFCGASLSAAPVGGEQWLLSLLDPDGAIESTAALVPARRWSAAAER